MSMRPRPIVTGAWLQFSYVHIDKYETVISEEDHTNTTVSTPLVFIRKHIFME